MGYQKSNDLIADAIRFAIGAHAGMTRKGGDIPYIMHPLEAMAIAAGLTGDEEIIAAAVLHDVLEDTEVTGEDLRSRFGKRVLDLVKSDSEDKRDGKPAGETWRMRKQETIDFLTDRANRDEKIIALADKLSNMRAIWADQIMIGDALWERFNVKDKEEHGWYYSCVAKALRDLNSQEPCPAYIEYCKLVEAVFGEYLN